ncbi:hypothetical protein RKD22_004860 [Streptomyces pristinaespiralis]
MTGSARLPAATIATAAVSAARQDRPTAAAPAAAAVPAARSTDPEARAASAAPAPFVPRHRTRSSHP